MKKQKIAMILTSGFTLFVVITGVLSLLPIFRFESWVNSRIKIFAEMPYSEWKELHVACAELETLTPELNLGRKDTGYERVTRVDPGS